MSASLSSETISIIKSTAPVIQQHGVAITTRMYERLFVDSEMKELFDEAAQKSGEQPKRLAAALLAFASNADNLDVLKDGSFKIRMGYAVCGLIEVKSSLPAIKNSTVRIVSKFV
ncbi:MAG: hypothetical protein JO009_03535 [Candidatus Eremiobacteraeota bacterium]|nr:hypothetical protein [Candidatus Eremiobacteraeota bacterium]